MAQIKKGRIRKRARPRAAGQSQQPTLTREQFAKISEVEGVVLTPEMKKTFAEFDRKKLTPAERREAIIERFGRGGK